MMKYRPLLKQWSIELLASPLAARLESPPPVGDWLGNAPATKAEIAELENRLGLLLPPSYKSFLNTSNGWGRISAFIGRLRPAVEVDWFHVENENWVDPYAQNGSSLPDDDYYVYDNAASGHDHRAEHMATLVQISDVEDGVLLLNPQAVTPDGEWEAWFFANWVPGATRYPSFAHLLKSAYHNFRTAENVLGKPARWPQLPIPEPDVPRVPAERSGGTIKRSESLDELLNEIQSDDERGRAKAVRRFFGKLKGRPRATRRPDLVGALEAAFARARESDVRCLCIAALTELADDDAPPGALFAALSDDDPAVVLQGMFALHDFPDRRAVDPLCRFVGSRKNVLFNENAMSHLGEMRDPMAIPTLSGVLHDVTNTFDQSFTSAGGALGRIGGDAIDILIAALAHADARVRLGAVVGLDISGDERAIIHLDRMLNDPDPRVRTRAGQRLGGYPGDH